MKAYTRPTDYRPYLTVLYQGPVKTGKTYCALSFPNPLVVYAEENVSTAEKFPDAALLLCHNIDKETNEDHGWQTFEALELQLLPMLESGKADEIAGKKVETIVVDSLTEVLLLLQQSIQGQKSKMTFADFSAFLTRGDKLIRRFLRLSKPSPHHPRYHVVMTVHERDVYDDDGNLVAVRPNIMGQLKDTVGRLFDTVFITKSIRSEKVVTTPNGATTETDERRVVWTFPQDRYHECGDGVGGGPLKTLPSICDGTYPTLEKLWGLPTPTDNNTTKEDK